MNNFTPLTPPTIDWEGEMINSTIKKIKTGFEIYNDRDKAINYAKENSVAGKKILDIAINKFFDKK